MIKFPEQVNFVIKKLEESGFEAFIVGGCVRDFLLNKMPKDFDVTTNALPNEVVELFSNKKIVETGLKHGTVTLVLENYSVEITTYRNYENHMNAKNFNSKFLSAGLLEDLGKRDFTINSIAYSKENGIIDPFDGQKDLQNKIVKAVGDVDKRFNEDALRILRGARFSSVLNFEIESKTLNSMKRNKKLLNNISVERVYCELSQTLLGENLVYAFDKTIDIWVQIIPELSFLVNFEQNKNSKRVLIQTLCMIDNLPRKIYLRLAGLFLDVGKTFSNSKNCKAYVSNSEQIVKNLLLRLKVDNVTYKKVLTLIKYYDYKIEEHKISIKKLLQKIDVELFKDLLLLKKAKVLASNKLYKLKKIDNIQLLLNEILLNNECYNLMTLKIKGNDLLDLGFDHGKTIGETLNFLLNEIICGKVENDKVSLIEYLKKHKLCQ